FGEIRRGGQSQRNSAGFGAFMTVIDIFPKFCAKSLKKLYGLMCTEDIRSPSKKLRLRLN
ncbi:MAG TPA: hypothetical protein PLS57_09960, partial [Smithellaceae bacterium]|nr:hypothetical protein [Smithellaceae bacterium]